MQTTPAMIDRARACYAGGIGLGSLIVASVGLAMAADSPAALWAVLAGVPVTAAGAVVAWRVRRARQRRFRRPRVSSTAAFPSGVDPWDRVASDASTSALSAETPAQARSLRYTAAEE